MQIVFSLIQNGILAASLSVLVGIGFFLAFSARGFFDLSSAVLLPLGGYGVIAVTRWLQAPVWVGVLAAILCTGFLAYAVDLGLFRRFQLKRAGALTLLVVSLGVMSVLQAVLTLVFSSRFQTVPSLVSRVHSFPIGPWFTLTPIHTLTIVTAIAAICIFGALLQCSSFGKALRALRDDATVAKTIGIPTRRITSQAVFLAGGLMGLSGLLIGMDVGVEPTNGFGTLLKAVTAALFGGFTSLRGLAIGALVLGGLEQLTVWFFPSAWKEALVFLVLLVVLKVRASNGRRLTA